METTALILKLVLTGLVFNKTCHFFQISDTTPINVIFIVEFIVTLTCATPTVT